MNNVNMTNNHRDREMVDIHTVILTGVHLSKNDKDRMDYRISPKKAIRTGIGIKVLEAEMKKEVAYDVKHKNTTVELLIPEIIEDVTYGISQKENEGDKETLNDILNERRIGGFAVCFEGAISQSMLQEHYDIKDYFGKADYVYDCGDGEFSLVFYIAQYEDKTIEYLFKDDGWHCNDVEKEMEEERQRAKAADKRMELFERGFKEQFMYER